MADFPIAYAFWPSLIAFGLGLLACIPVWWKGSRTGAGRNRPTTEQDVAEMRFAALLLTAGSMGVLITGLTMASRSMSFGAFMVLCGSGVVALILIALAVDARRARRHR